MQYSRIIAIQGINFEDQGHLIFRVFVTLRVFHKIITTHNSKEKKSTSRFVRTATDRNAYPEYQ